MRNIILLLSCILFFTGCMTQKKQQRIAHSYFSLHPDELAKICSSKYPAETKFIKGETVTKIDTVTKTDTVEADCPDGTKIKTPCPPNKTITIDNTRIDTLEVLPSGVKAQLQDQINKIRDLQIDLVKKDSDHKKTILELNEAKYLSTRRLFIIIALGVLICAGVFLRIKNIL